MTKQEYINNILCLASYLGWGDPKRITGAYTNEQARKAFCELLNLPEDIFTRLKIGDYE